MQRHLKFTFLVLSLAGLLHIAGASAQAQEPTVAKLQDAIIKAGDECTRLWSDHAFDRVREKLWFGGKEPTPAMLTNTERVRPQDKRIIDLAIKFLEKCNEAFAPVYQMLPQQANLLQAIDREQEALLATH